MPITDHERRHQDPDITTLNRLYTFTDDTIHVEPTNFELINFELINLNLRHQLGGFDEVGEDAGGGDGRSGARSLHDERVVPVALRGEEHGVVGPEPDPGHFVAIPERNPIHTTSVAPRLTAVKSASPGCPGPATDVY